MSPAEDIAPYYNDLESCQRSQKQFHSDVHALLDDIGVEFLFRKVVRDYEIEATDPITGDPGDIMCTYHNRSCTKSAFVWVGDSTTSSRSDGLTCSIQLYGEKPGAKPGSLHSVKLSKLWRLELTQDAIKGAILQLFADDL